MPHGTLGILFDWSYPLRVEPYSCGYGQWVEARGRITRLRRSVYLNQRGDSCPILLSIRDVTEVRIS
jgi:hypothetical protein